MNTTTKRNGSFGHNKGMRVLVFHSPSNRKLWEAPITKEWCSYSPGRWLTCDDPWRAPPDHGERANGGAFSMCFRSVAGKGVAFALRGGAPGDQESTSGWSGPLAVTINGVPFRPGRATQTVATGDVIVAGPLRCVIGHNPGRPLTTPELGSYRNVIEHQCPPEGDADQKTRASLVFQNGPHLGKRVSIKPPPDWTSIGTSPLCDYRLTGRDGAPLGLAVSHRRSGGSVGPEWSLVAKNQGRPGTVRKGRWWPLMGEKLLTHGEVISVGPYLLRVDYPREISGQKGGLFRLSVFGITDLDERQRLLLFSAAGVTLLLGLTSLLLLARHLWVLLFP